MFLKNKIIMYCALIPLLLNIHSCTFNQSQEIVMDHVKTLDLSQYSSAPPETSVNLLFIHHSTGGQLLADKGPYVGKDCIYKTFPEGGGLRSLLEKNNYIVHEASYTSIVGDKTDICDWNAKFRDKMDKVLTCKSQDEFFTDNTKNKIIVFKSCFPNNWIESDGKTPGNPDSCEKTLANAKAAYQALLPYFENHPDTLFVAFTVPPLAKPILYKRDKVKQFVKTFLGRPDTIDKIGNRARNFSNWLKNREKGWLKNYTINNIVVFDYYDVLTGHGKSNWSAYPTQGGRDSHPSSEGNITAARKFIPFLNAAVHRAGIK
jgi:hypothetical protein